MWDWLTGLAGKSAAPSKTTSFTDWRRSVGVDDNTYSGLDQNSVQGLQQAHVTPPAVTQSADWLGLANLGLKGMGAFTDWQQMQTAKDTLNFNKMNANRAYEADKLKYNNTLARTEAINDFYGSKNVATKLQ